MRSLGIKCYYNNNGEKSKVEVICSVTLPSVPLGEVRDDPPVECQDETPLDKPYCLWTIEGLSKIPGFNQRICSPHRPISGQVSAAVSRVRVG